MVQKTKKCMFLAGNTRTSIHYIDNRTVYADGSETGVVPCLTLLREMRDQTAINETRNLVLVCVRERERERERRVREVEQKGKQLLSCRFSGGLFYDCAVRHAVVS